MSAVVQKTSAGTGTSARRPTDVAGLLAAAVGALEGAHRPGQLAMAQAVDAAIATREHLLVQAGTGTGKSLAYLVPLVRHALDSCRPVVVSTATLALQHQVVERDLPRLAHALSPILGRRPTMQTVKGRANYVCLQKLAGGFPEDDALFDLPALPGTVVTSSSSSSSSSRLGREVARLRDWAEHTESGDRDELAPGVSERAWRHVSVTAHECLGAQKCSLAADCFVEKARERAGEVDVVVTNHALLAIDAFEGRQILPDHAVLVVDEAHELADRVTSVISDELTSGAVSAAARRAGTHGGVDADGLQQAADDLAAVLAALPEGRFATGLPQSLQTALGRVRDTARQVTSALQQRSRDQPLEAASEGAVQLARAAVSDVFDVAERMSAGLDGDVLWLSRERAGSGEPRPTLRVAPLSVAALLREHLFEGRTVVLTSATLTLGGTFDAAARQLGLSTSASEEGDDVRWRGIDVGSPFEYPRQAILYVARRLPPPGRDPISEAFLDELTALVEAAGGRTLGLFSSRRAAETAAEAMRSRLDVDVLCQGDDAIPNLVRQFAAEPSTCLFGTLSLWQGVDVPGPSCELVVIDRLPFPRPDDPLSSARQEAVAKAGGNAFMAVAAQHAALRLAQGAGRLVRSTSDRGVVAVLDSRLATARYAGYLRASLPPFWTTYDREVALGALRRLNALSRG